ncbi:MAG TPA: citryl-CoA lyase [Polyangiaceae bacterium]
MSPRPETPTTSIATHTPEDVFVRGRSLCRELIGKLTFTEMTFLHVTGRVPTPAQTAMVDACLVTLMEHGLTPSAVATRLVYSSAPEAMQAAVAAGLLAVGSAFVGTVEGCAALLERVRAAPDAAAEARSVAEEHRAARRPVPGFGHPEHKPDDPRSVVLLELAATQGVAGAQVTALRALAAAVDATAGKHVTINATGAVAAVLGDCGLPAEILRGFAVLARCAGLVGHAHEEQHRPAMRAIWEAAERAVPYDGKR